MENGWTTAVYENHQRAVGLGVGTFGLVMVVACTPAEAQALEGVLENVDSVSGEVTVKLKDGSTVTLNLEDVSVATLGDAVGAASLEPGDEVSLEIDDNDEDVVTKVTTHRAEVDGTIQSVDVDAQTVTVTAENGVDFTIKVTPETKIEAEETDGNGTLADLVVGLQVEVKYNVDTETAIKIEVEDGHDDEDEGEFEGVITAINNDTKEITLQAENGAEASYTVVSDTRLKSGVNTFSDLQVGMEAQVKFDRVTNELLAVEAEGDEEQDDGDGAEIDEGEFEGTITAINNDTKEITLRTEDGEEGTFTVVSDTRLEHNDVSTFADLEEGMKAKVKFGRTTNELIEVEAEN
jgi:hypothetical protein